MQKQRNTEKNYPYSAPGRWRRNSRVDKVLPLSGLTAAPAKSPICSDSGLQRKILIYGGLKMGFWPRFPYPRRNDAANGCGRSRLAPLADGRLTFSTDAIEIVMERVDGRQSVYAKAVIQ